MAIIGPWPPPVGGVSVHVSRLARLLGGDYDVAVFDPYRRENPGKAESPELPGVRVVACGGALLSPLLQLSRAVRRFDPALIHIHVSGMRRFALAGNLLLAGLPHQTPKMLTIHSGSFSSDHFQLGPLQRSAIRRVLGKFTRVIGVSERITEFGRAFGVSPARSVTLPAFLPPAGDAHGSGQSYASSPKEVGRIGVLAAGYAIPDYGFDLLVSAIASDPVLVQRVHLTICFYSTYDQAYVEKLEQLLQGLGAVSVHRDLSPDGFAAVLAGCQVFVRPTTRDGDSVALREAVHAGKQVVASDCVDRPVGVALFPSRSVSGLAGVLRQAVEHPGVGLVESRLADIAGVYRRCIEAALEVGA